MDLQGHDPEYAVDEATADESMQTLQKGIAAYQIGTRIKRLRTNKNMGLAELGRHTSLSPAMLSKLENGKVMPTLPTLLRIALVFSVGLEHFFQDADARKLAIVRREERMGFDEMMKTGKPVYHFECLDYTAVDRKTDAYLATFESFTDGAVPQHEHPGSEFIHVLEGTLGLLFEDTESILRSGDSAYFESRFAHGYRKIGSEACRALVVTA
jgi:transcriptional regulator with XRE-family HTH domain